MIRLADVVEANRVLVALGGEDQMQRIAAASIERSLELQNRIDRALAYAAQTPANSAHARQIARILDGSITVDDEMNEVTEHDRPMPERFGQFLDAPPAPERHSLPAPTPPPSTRKRRGAPPPRSGLAGRTPTQRKAFRQWATENGYNVPKQGPVAVELVQEYDDAMADERKQRAAERKSQRDGQLPI